MAVDVTKVSEIDVEPGELPGSMAAWVIREEREGEPKDAFQLEEIVANLGSGSGANLHGLDPAVASQVKVAANDAFIHALSSGMWLSAGVAALGVLLAFWLIAPKTVERPDPARQPEAAAEAVFAE